MSRISKRETVFETAWFRVVAKTVTGEKGDAYYSLALGDYSTVIPVTAEGKIVLVRQFRAAVERRTLEFPSGMVERGEKPERAIKRELLEETGYQARRLEFIGVLATDMGRMSNRLWCYFAPDVKLSTRSKGPEAGIRVETVTRSAFWRAVRDGRFDHSLNLSVLALAVARGRMAPEGERRGAR